MKNEQTQSEIHAEGMTVRREVLGDAHVDEANAGTTDFNADFFDFINRYAWGEIWNRPGLDRRTRSMLTLALLTARGHREEFKPHIIAALNNGLTREEIKEVILHTALYAGLPAANTAFHLAAEVFKELD